MAQDHLHPHIGQDDHQAELQVVELVQQLGQSEVEGAQPSAFTADAADYASRIDTKVVLLDGNAIANLMIDFHVGVSVAASYIVKRIDSDYFEQE